MAIEQTDLEKSGITCGDETRRLVLKAANAAIASSIPREDVLRRLEQMQEDPSSCSGDLLFADAAYRFTIKEK